MAAGTSEGFPEDDEHRDRGDTRILPETAGPAGPGARGTAPASGAGDGSLDDRGTRIDFFSAGNDRTQVLSGAPHRADPAARPGDTGVPAAPDGTEPTEGARWTKAAAPGGERAGGPWDTERTTTLRVPRAGGPGTGTTRLPSPPGVRPPARDPWQEEAAEPEAATHDPHEVTVQLDAVQFGDGGLLQRTPGRAGGEQDAGPVFVDESGRRSRLYRRMGLAVGLACAGYAVVMVATLLSGNSDAPWMPVPGQQEHPAGQVETSQRPEETDGTPGSGSSLLPDDTPTTGVPALPEPGATAPGSGTSGATGTTDEPGTTSGPTPTPTRRDTTRPGTGGDDTPAPPAETPTTPVPDPTTTDGPTPGTTAPADDGGDTDNLAGAPVEGSVGHTEPSVAHAAPSPENVL